MANRSANFIARLRKVSLACYTLSAGTIFLVIWFQLHLTNQAVASVDLPGHVAATERLLEQLRQFNFNPTFYDPRWFSGWPAFHFYAFLCHLLTAVLGLVLGIVFDSPVRLAAHLVLVLGCALLPWSMFYFASPLLRQLCAGDESKARSLRSVLALSAVTFSFWFLNHDGQWYGVGAASVMNIGLFSQLLGWHWLLINLGALLRVLNREPSGAYWFVSVSFALLFLSHSLTSIYGAFLAVLSFFWFYQHRLLIAKAYLLGLGLCAFWLLPFLAYSSAYVGFDHSVPQGDFLEIFLRYPLYDLYRTFKTWFGGEFQAIDITNVLVLFLLVAAFGNLRLRSSPLFIAFGVFSLIGVVVFSSEFVASSIPLGIHYYRFAAYTLLLVSALFCVIPLAFLTGARSTVGLRRFLPPGAVAAILGVCLASTVAFPHSEREKIVLNSTNGHLSTEDQVLDYLDAQEVSGRVLFGYFRDDRFTYLAAHYMESQLFAKTGRETVTGLFAQSSLAYRMPIASANLLDLKTYNLPLLFTANSDLDDDTKLRQLLEFGVSHLVIGQKAALDRLRPYSHGEPKQIGPYTVVQIADQQFGLVQEVTKQLIGYVDQRGNLPFNFIEFYFYANKRFTNNFELISLPEDEPVPEGISTVIVNGNTGTMAETPSINIADGTQSRQTRIVRLDYRNSFQLDHYNMWYGRNFERDEYNAVERYLTRELRLDIELLQVEKKADQRRPPSTNFHWDPDYQGFSVSDLTPGRFYRVNYSYFPYWRSNEARVFRGSGERIFIVPDKSQVRLHYTRTHTVSFWLGVALSLASALLLWVGAVTATARRPASTSVASK